MKIIVVGGGEIGTTLTTILSAEKHDVSVIENDPERAKEIASDTTALVLKGDGVDLDILKQAGIEKCDAIVATTGDDKVNLMVCQIAKSNNSFL